MKASPTTRMGWHKHYVYLFNKTNGKRGEHLANWFLLLHLAFDEKPINAGYKTSRKERAHLLWKTVIFTSYLSECRSAAKELLDLKRTYKVSWITLGLPEDTTESLTRLL